MTGEFLDQAHRDSLKATDAIRRWVAAKHVEIAHWQPRPLPPARPRRWL